jgi:hypothetical protein
MWASMNLSVDEFNYGIQDHIAPLYSLDAAKRTVHPLIGSASPIKSA